MAKLEDIGSETRKPEVNAGTRPSPSPRTHLREPHSAHDSPRPTTSASINAPVSPPKPSNATSNTQLHAATGFNGLTPPPGYQPAYAFVPENATLPRDIDSQTVDLLRAFGTGWPRYENQQKDAGPPPLPPKPKNEASSQAVALADMMASISKLMASNLLQSEKMLSNAVAAPENGFYNIYSEAGDKYLDLDQTNTKEGTSIIAWPHIFAHNLAQTWKFFRQSREGFLCTIQNKHTEGHFHVDRAMTREGSPRRIVQTSTPVVWQLLPLGANKFKFSMLSDWAEKYSVLTFVENEDTYNTIQLLPEDNSNAFQVWTFTTRGLHH